MSKSLLQVIVEKIFPPKEEVIQFEERELDAVREFAQGDQSKRQAALQVYHRYLGRPQYRSTTVMGYLSEVDSVCPDPMLKEHYRRKIVDKA